MLTGDCPGPATAEVFSLEIRGIRGHRQNAVR